MSGSGFDNETSEEEKRCYTPYTNIHYINCIFFLENTENFVV